MLPLSPESFPQSLDLPRRVGGTDATGPRAENDGPNVKSSPSLSGFFSVPLSLLSPSQKKTIQKPSASDKSSSGFVNSAWSAGGGAAPGVGAGASTAAGDGRSNASSSTSAAVAAAAASSALVDDNSSKGGGGGGGWSTVTKGGGSSSSSQQQAGAANAANAAVAAAAAAPSQERKWAREDRPSNSR